MASKAEPLTPMSEHQSEIAGFLARRGLGVLVSGFSLDGDVVRGDRIDVEFAGLRFGVAALGDRVVLDARASAASFAERAS